MTHVPPDPAILAQVDQDLAKFSDAVHRNAEQLAAAITVLGYEAAVMNFWSWLNKQPAETRGWLAAVAFAELARQHPGDGPPPAALCTEAPSARPATNSRTPGRRHRPGLARIPFRLSRLLRGLLPSKTVTASAVPSADCRPRQSGSE